VDHERVQQPDVAGVSSHVDMTSTLFGNSICRNLHLLYTFWMPREKSGDRSDALGKYARRAAVWADIGPQYKYKQGLLGTIEEMTKEVSVDMPSDGAMRVFERFLDQECVRPICGCLQSVKATDELAH